MTIGSIPYAFAAILASASLFAQSPIPQSSPQPQARRQWGAGRQAGGPNPQASRLWAAALNLTPEQKTQAQAIFQQARQDAQPVRQQLRDSQRALRDAVSAQKSEQDIDVLAASQGVLMGKLIAIRTKSAGKFYALLTPEQQQKYNQLRHAPGARVSGNM